MTEEMIRTEYRATRASFNTVFKGDWDKYQEAVKPDMIIFRAANLTNG